MFNLKPTVFRTQINNFRLTFFLFHYKNNFGHSTKRIHIEKIEEIVLEKKETIQLPVSVIVRRFLFLPQ